MKTSETLHAAADFIEVNGWGQGANTWSGQDGYCIEGALAAVAGWPMVSVMGQSPVPDTNAKLACPAYQAVYEYLHRSPFIWNDERSPITGQAEVIEVLRACALIEESREKVVYATITLENQSLASVIGA